MARAGTYAKRASLRGQVVELVAGGSSLSATALALGIRLDFCARLLRDGIAALPAQDVDELRGVTELRLDRLAATYSELMTTGTDEKTRLAGANGLLAVERDRVRLLGTYQRPPKDE